MKKIMISIENNTYDRIKSNAELEKRSVTNYIQCLMNTLFAHNQNIKTGGILYISYSKDSINLTNDDIKKSIEIDDNVTKINNHVKKSDDLVNRIAKFNVDLIENTNTDISKTSDTYESYIELHELGQKLRLENDAKPELLRSTSYIFSTKITDHTRGWLYRNPSCTMEDYKRAFPNMF